MQLKNSRRLVEGTSVATENGNFCISGYGDCFDSLGTYPSESVQAVFVSICPATFFLTSENAHQNFWAEKLRLRLFQDYVCTLHENSAHRQPSAYHQHVEATDMPPSVIANSGVERGDEDVFKNFSMKIMPHTCAAYVKPKPANFSCHTLHAGCNFERLVR